MPNQRRGRPTNHPPSPPHSQRHASTSTLDRVFVTGVPIFARHGVLPQEAELGQRFVVDVTAHVDASPAAAADSVEGHDTISYADLHAAAVRIVGAGPRRATVEALATGVANDVLANHAAVAGVTVKVVKPAAPIEGLFESAGCELTRWRR